MKRLSATTTPWVVLGTLAAVGSSVLCASWASGDSHDVGIERIVDGDATALADTDPGGLEAPARPRPGRCPDGFPKITLADGTAVCSPWADGERALCPEGQARFPGDPGCAPVGSACDASERGDAALYVRSGRAGDVATLADALAIAAPGDVIQLGAGTHVAPARIDRDVHIRGACVGETRVVAPDPRAAIEIAADMSLSDLALASALVVAPNAHLSLSGASIRSDAVDAIVVRSGGVVVVSESVIRSGATAISVEAGGTLDLQTADVQGAIAVAVRGLDARATIERTSLDAEGRAALAVSGGARAVADRLVIGGRSEEGVHVEGAGTTLSLRWAFLPSGDGPRGVGVHLSDGASASIEGSRLESGGDARVVVEGGATLDVRDSFVASDGRGGIALGLSSGAHVLLERVDVRGATGRAFDVDGAYLVARDLSITGPVGGAALPSSEAALAARGGAQVEIRRAEIDRPRTRGLVATGEGTALTIHFAVIRGARRSECATFSGCDGTPGGDALAVLAGAALRADHVSVEGSRGCGVVVAGAWSTLDLAYARILDNRVGLCADGAEPGALRFGAGVVEAGNESSFARPRPRTIALRE